MLRVRRLTTQDISWFLDQHRTGQLDLDPPYQRRSIWSLAERKFFLDTIFRNYPSPSVFLYKSVDTNGRHTYHVVDGKQRLETIIKFTEGEIQLSRELGDERLNGKKWDELELECKQQFWDYVLSVELLSSVDGVVVNEVFDRFNRNARKLQAQELRHAKYDGWFIKQAEGEAQEEIYRKFRLFSDKLATRMKDVQFVSELLCIILDQKIVGFDQLYLDQKYADYDAPAENKVDFNEEDFDAELSRIKGYLSEIEEVNNCVSSFAKTFTHFYSLWGLVALHGTALPLPQQFASTYALFMREVESCKKAAKSDSGESNSNTPSSSYYANSIGAMTEAPQRKARHAALLTLLDEK